MEISPNYYPAERQQKILALLNQVGRVSVYNLCKEFGVSEVTIRSDLQSLARQNLIVRTHGGAVLAPRPPELSLVIRSQQHMPEKERIGEQAVRLVRDGDAIFLDASSTALALANRLHTLHDLTIITNSLPMAQMLLDTPGISVVMPGGVMQRDTVSLVGVDGLDLLKKYNIQKAFFGAHGISYPEGLTDVSPAEAEIKKAILKMCRKQIALVDATKWKRVGVASFTRLEDLNEIVTTQPVPPDMAEKVKQLGIKMTVV